LTHPLGAEPRPPQRIEHRQPERLRVALLAPHRHPRRTVAQTHRGDPRAQQERLPAPPCRHHMHPSLTRPHPLNQPTPPNHPHLAPVPADPTAAAELGTTPTWSPPGCSTAD